MEGKWEAKASRVFDEFGLFVCTAKNAETARNIVREHNAHGELVEALSNRRDCLYKQRLELARRNAQNGASTTILVDCCIEGVNREISIIDSALSAARGE